jgi:catechol-2,3-dioxygenase
MPTTHANPVLHHVNLKTGRLAEMIDWYCAVTGSEVTFAFPGGAWLTNDAANHRIAMLAGPQIVDDPDRFRHSGMHHLAFEYASVDALLDNYVRLKDEIDAVPHMCLDHGMTISFYYVDPDGNSLELQADWFGDWARSKAFMQGHAAFATNPIGTFVDPDQVVAARRAGASIQALHERAYGGEFAPDVQPDIRVAL